jgi:hypothetical protein
MLRPKTIINIGDETFGFVTSLNTSSAWETFTDTGQLTIPNKVKKDGQSIAIGEDNVFKRGDAIEIAVGYYPDTFSIFSGYVSKILPELPFTIEFQDAAWLLKQTNVTFALKSCSVKELIAAAISKAKEKATGEVAEALGRLKVEAIDAQLGSFRITNANLVQVLEELKKTYSLTSFFRGETLYCGLAYYGDGAKHTFTFQQDIIESQLEYNRADDVKIKIKAVSMLPNNTKIEVEAGDPDGEQRTLFKFNLTKEELTKAAEREKDRFKYEGFRGTFRTFAYYDVKHGDTVELIDKRLPEKNGEYFVAGVNYESGVDGLFCIITLGAKVSSINIEA